MKAANPIPSALQEMVRFRIQGETPPPSRSTEKDGVITEQMLSDSARFLKGNR